ncbi:hypothetical protein PC122_g11967 [Phytophthora cactorum]|nr:hypothetical protein PC122_g11967 [Phytophthora cactorum]
MAVLIDEWKRSDQVAYTRGGNPKPPSSETVVLWVTTAQRKSQTTFNRNGGVVGNDSAAPGSRQCGEEEHRLVRRGLRHLWTIKLLIAAAPTRTRSTSCWTL